MSKESLILYTIAKQGDVFKMFQCLVFDKDNSYVMVDITATSPDVLAAFGGRRTIRKSDMEALKIGLTLQEAIELQRKAVTKFYLGAKKEYDSFVNSWGP